MSKNCSKGNDHMTNRQAYQKEYASTHSDTVRERKELERDRRDRCRSYWYKRIVWQVEWPFLIADCTPGMVEATRKRYEKTLAQTA